MAYDGATTIVGPAIVRELKFSTNGSNKPYIYLDVYFEEGREEEEFRRIGLVFFGDDAKAIADKFSMPGKCMVNIIGHIATRPYKASGGKNERVSTGLETVIVSVSNMQGDDFLNLEKSRFVAFR